MNKELRERLLNKLEALGFQVIGVHTSVLQVLPQDAVKGEDGLYRSRSQRINYLFNYWINTIKKIEEGIIKLRPFARNDESLTAHLDGLSAQIEEHKIFITASAKDPSSSTIN